MLILERHEGESIRIGPNILVSVTRMKPDGRNSVKLGITAPRSVRIDRIDETIDVARERVEQQIARDLAALADPDAGVEFNPPAV